MKRWLNLKGVHGRVAAPPSKSVAQRLLALTLLAKGKIVLYGLGEADDVVAAQNIVSALAVSVEKQADGGVCIESLGKILGHGAVHCGESGLGLRMFAPLVALADKPVTLTASAGLRRRPMDMLLDLQGFGVRVELSDGFAPLTITGPLRSAQARVDGQRTSQLITGLIMALSQCKGDSTLEFTGRLASRPYVELTLDCMSRFGLRAELSESGCTIPGGQTAHMPLNLTVDGDWSGAAFWLVAGAIAGPLTVENLRLGSHQADEAICEALRLAGAKVIWQGHGLTVDPTLLRPFHFDASDCPDLFPPLVVLAAACPGHSQIRGVSRLSIKECDRGLALIEMITALGGAAGIDESSDTLWVEGGKTLRFAQVKSHGDHRMVMTAAILSLLTPGGLEIDDTEPVSKSYAEFFTDFVSLGGVL